MLVSDPIRDAYRIAATADRATIRARALAAPAGSVAARLLTAVAAQYEGDVDGAIALLRRLLSSASDDDRGAVADILAPLLGMRERFDEMLRLAAELDAVGWTAAAASFRAIVTARRGEGTAARTHFARAQTLLESELDDVLRARAQQRLAHAALSLREYDRALQLALASARTNERIGAHRSAAAGYWLAYTVHQDITGQRDEAARLVAAWYREAVRSDDISFVHAALVADFELAVCAADDDHIGAVRSELRSLGLPQQYGERFAMTFFDALARGFADLTAMRSLLQLIRDVHERSRGEWALCSGLIAISYAAQADDDAARNELRAAISHLGRARASDPAYERRYRRLARIAVAVACDMLGDRVRGDRSVRCRELHEDAQDELTLRVAAHDDRIDVSRWNRGFARIYRGAWRLRRKHLRPAGLTAAELEVLRLLGDGWTAGRIAAETERSINTVYNHTRSILSKFDAARSGEAVAIARRIGLLH